MPVRDRLQRELSEGDMVVCTLPTGAKECQVFQVMEPLVSNEKQVPVRRVLLTTIFEIVIPADQEVVPGVFLIAKAKAGGPELVKG